MRRLLILKLSFWVKFFLILGSFANAKEVFYPNFTPGFHSHFIEVLELAIKHTKIEHDYKVMPLPYILPSAQRTFRHFKNKKMQILWSSCDSDFEKEYTPIYLPLAKGVLSYRIGLIHKNSTKKLKSVESLEDLHYVKIGQGFGWPDIAIYENHGINVTQANLTGLIKMLEENRIDMIPLGIGEIKKIKELFTKSKDVKIYQDLILYYPWPMVFYVHKENTHLAKVLKSGLNEIVSNGKLEKKFQEHFGKAKELLSSTATKIKMENKKLCQKFPKDKSTLWIQEVE